MHQATGLEAVDGPPTFVPCSLCGRKFSQRSLRFHEPQCALLSKAITESENKGNKTKNKTRKTRNRTSISTPASKINKQEYKRNYSTSTIVLRHDGSSERENSQVLRANNLPEDISLSDLLERPRTQTLKYPTPNIDHPVIPSLRTVRGELPTVRTVKKEKLSETVVIEQPLSSSGAKIDRTLVKIGKSKKSPPLSSCCGLHLISDQDISFCKACDRSDRPEKLHRHPSLRIDRIPKDTSESSLTRSDLPSKSRAPVKIYKHARMGESFLSIRPHSIPAIQFDRAVLVDNKGASNNPLLFATCHMCGKQYASKSFQIHLRRCVERWEIENEPLPAMKSRTAVVGASTTKAYDVGVSEKPWEAFQNQLVACPHCARTFLPERLRAHERTCNRKDGYLTENKEHQETKKTVRRPPMVVCYICGRQFGTHSISLHEPHCLKKWRLENDRLPKHLRRPEPQKPETILSETSSLSNSPENMQLAIIQQPQLLVPVREDSTPETAQPSNSRQLSRSPRSPVTRSFRQQQQTRSTYEAPWGRPLRQTSPAAIFARRQQFVVPQYQIPRSMVPPHVDQYQAPRYTDPYVTPRFRGPFPGARACWIFFLRRDGEIDLDAMAEAAWQSHLDQLVPCDRCGRTFLPDRLPVHQRGCHETSGTHVSKGRRG